MNTFDFEYLNPSDSGKTHGRIVKAESLADAKNVLADEGCDSSQWILVKEIDRDGTVVFDPFAGIF